MGSSVPQIYVPIYQSAARTATPTAVEFNDYSHPRVGGHFTIDCTAVTATPSVVPTIDGYDPLSGKWYNLLTGAAVVATGTTVLTVYPLISAVANVSVSNFLPPRWRVVMTHADTDSITYSVSAQLRG